MSDTPEKHFAWVAVGALLALLVAVGVVLNFRGGCNRGNRHAFMRDCTARRAYEACAADYVKLEPACAERAQ